MLQWAQQHDEAEQALTDDDNLFMDHRPTRDSLGEQLPIGQPDLCADSAEQAHMLGPNNSSAQCRSASTPTRHVKQAHMQEPNNSSAQSGGACTPDPTTGSNKHHGEHQPPTDKYFPWNDEFHKKIIKECDHQDRISWECKLEALAHLLSIAEAKQAIATIHGHLNTQYIKANWLIHNV